MGEEEKDVVVDCECEKTLLDIWFPPEAVQLFITRLAAALSELFPEFSSAQVAADIQANSLYRFVVPPFLAFVSLGSRNSANMRDTWIDLDQFVRSREKISRESIEDQMTSISSAPTAKFYHSEQEVLDELPGGKIMTITLNPRLPGDLVAEEQAGIYYTKVSVTQCFIDGVLSSNSLSFSSRSPKMGRFSIDKATVSLALSMKKMLTRMESQLQKQSFRSLVCSKESLSKLCASLQQSFNLPQASLQLNSCPTAPVQELQNSLESEVLELQSVLDFLERPIQGESPQSTSQLPSMEAPLQVPNTLYLTLEREKELVVYLKNPTVFSYPELWLRLVSAHGDVLEELRITNVNSGWKEVILKEKKIREMVENGGRVLQLDSFSLSIAGIKWKDEY